jgi:hypothetical protein
MYDEENYYSDYTRALKDLSLAYQWAKDGDEEFLERLAELEGKENKLAYTEEALEQAQGAHAPYEEMYKNLMAYLETQHIHVPEDEILKLPF